MAVYLLTLLTKVFKLTPQDAGFRAAGFVVLATALRPVGGVLADKIGGSTILKWVFPVTAMFAVFLACPFDVDFHHLGMATSIGLGNGAVFRLVPEYFPSRWAALPDWLAQPADSEDSSLLCCSA
jgi:NNP family nitrate/nitrite transporter-like MFS transporter